MCLKRCMCLQRQAITDNPEWAFQRRRSRATAERSRASLADQGARAGSAPGSSVTLLKRQAPCLPLSCGSILWRSVTESLHVILSFQEHYSMKAIYKV